MVKILKREKDSELIIFIEADRLIDKMSIYRAEEVLKEHLFTSKGKTKVKFIERYFLSDQYNPTTLLEVYRDSFLREIERKSAFDHQIMKKADFSVEENQINITVDDNFVIRRRLPDIKNSIANFKCIFRLCSGEALR